jgi:hypothetical protein
VLGATILEQIEAEESLCPGLENHFLEIGRVNYQALLLREVPHDLSPRIDYLLMWRSG